MVNRLYSANHKSIGFYLKQLIILFAISFSIFSGCSGHFEHYALSEESEKASTSYKNVRLLNDDNKSEIILGSIYLNEVYPNYTDGLAHFLISFYNPEQGSALKFARSKTLKKQEYVVLLNGENAIASQELDSEDLMVDMMPLNNSWNRYYYVRYKLPSGTPFLVLENDRTERAVITYQTEQE